MDDRAIGLLHPGAMGTGIAAALVGTGRTVVWTPDGRSPDTARRAEDAGLTPVPTLADLVDRCGVILSICPPHAAVDVATEVSRAAGGFRGIYVDANAVSPATARRVADIVATEHARPVDGGIIGSPPPGEGDTHLYLSGADAPAIADLFTSTEVEAIVLQGSQTAASALKMTYAAWSKGTAALILAIRAAARHYGVEDDLLGEWERSMADLPATSERAARSAMTKGWRWSGEMEEVAATMAGAGLPDGFHQAAAEIYRRVPRRYSGEDDDVAWVLGQLDGSA